MGYHDTVGWLLLPLRDLLFGVGVVDDHVAGLGPLRLEALEY